MEKSKSTRMDILNWNLQKNEFYVITIIIEIFHKEIIF